MKNLSTSILLIATLHLGLCSQSGAQTFPEYYGTAADGQCMVYDGVTDNRWELLTCSLSGHTHDWTSDITEGSSTGVATFDTGVAKVVTSLDGLSNYLSDMAANVVIDTGDILIGVGGVLDDQAVPTCASAGQCLNHTGGTLSCRTLDYTTDIAEGSATGLAAFDSGVGVVRTSLDGVANNLSDVADDLTASSCDLFSVASGGTDWDDNQGGTFADGCIGLSNMSDVATVTADAGDVLAESGGVWDDVPLDTLTEAQTAIDDLLDVAPTVDYSGTITLGVSGGTWSSTSVEVARHKGLGAIVYLVVRATGTCGTTPDYITFTLPITPEVSENTFSCTGSSGGTRQVVAGRHQSSSTVRVYGTHAFGTAGWADGTCDFECTGVYEQT